MLMLSLRPWLLAAYIMFIKSKLEIEIQARSQNQMETGNVHEENLHRHEQYKIVANLS